MVLGFRKRDPASVGCYGKLPMHGDYVSHGSDGTEARWLTHWIDEGYRLSGGHDDPDAAETCFIFPGHGKRAIYGAMWPSADSSGTRRFPFSLFSTVQGRSISSFGSRIPVALSPAWSSMAGAVSSLKTAGSTDEVSSLVGTIELPEIPGTEQVEHSFSELSTPSGGIDRAADVLYDLRRLTEALGAARKGEAPSFAIRIPLRTTYPAVAESAAWLEILSRRLQSPSLPGDSHLFIRASTEAVCGELFVVHRELRADDLGFVLSPTEDYAYGNSLGEPRDDAGSSAYRDSFLQETATDPTLALLIEIGSR